MKFVHVYVMILPGGDLPTSQIHSPAALHFGQINPKFDGVGNRVGPRVGLEVSI